VVGAVHPLLLGAALEPKAGEGPWVPFDGRPRLDPLLDLPGAVAPRHDGLRDDAPHPRPPHGGLLPAVGQAAAPGPDGRSPRLRGEGSEEAPLGPALGVTEVEGARQATLADGPLGQPVE